MESNDKSEAVTFLRALRYHRCLYDKRHKGYSKYNVRLQAWKELAERISSNVETCKGHWSYYRRMLMRGLKTDHYLYNELQCFERFVEVAKPPLANLLNRRFKTKATQTFHDECVDAVSTVNTTSVTTADKALQCNMHESDCDAVFWREQHAYMARMNDRQKLLYKMNLNANTLHILDDTRDFQQHQQQQQHMDAGIEEAKVALKLVDKCHKLLSDLNRAKNGCQQSQQNEHHQVTPINTLNEVKSVIAIASAGDAHGRTPAH